MVEFSGGIEALKLTCLLTCCWTRSLLGKHIEHFADGRVSSVERRRTDCTCSQARSAMACMIHYIPIVTGTQVTHWWKLPSRSLEMLPDVEDRG